MLLYLFVALFSCIFQKSFINTISTNQTINQFVCLPHCNLNCIVVAHAFRIQFKFGFGKINITIIAINHFIRVCMYLMNCNFHIFHTIALHTYYLIVSIENLFLFCFTANLIFNFKEHLNPQHQANKHTVSCIAEYGLEERPNINRIKL